eukprot:479140-Pelagomonas_calceolata.AAC.2
MQAAPAIHCLLQALLRQQNLHQRLPHPHIRAGGAGPAPHRISKLLCLHLSIHAAIHTIIRT